MNFAIASSLKALVSFSDEESSFFVSLCRRGPAGVRRDEDHADVEEGTT
jgi:hypothetical protein